MVATGKAKDRIYIGKKFQETCELPDLIGIQKESYENFLQGEKIKAGVEPASGQGLQEVFESTFPIASQNNEMILHFKSYNLDFNNIKFTESECKREGRTYSVPLKATVFLELSETGEIREKEIFLGDLPLMTDRGTFIINGAERVVVSQIHRSPGVIFAREKGVLSSRIIPYRGSWLEFEIDEKKKVIVTKIDRKKKILGTLFLRAIGFDTREKILERFYSGEEIPVSKKNKDALAGVRLRKDVAIPGGAYLKAGDVLGAAEVDALVEAGVPSIEAIVFGGRKCLVSGKSKDKPIGLRLHKDVWAAVGGQQRKIASAGDLIERRPKKAEGAPAPEPGPGVVYMEDLVKAQVGTVYVNDLATPRDDVILHCFEIEEAKYTDQQAGEREPSKETVLTRIFSVLMSGEMVSVERAERELPEMFFSTRRYDLGAVGRYKLNKKFGPDGVPPEEEGTGDSGYVLRPDDILNTMRFLIRVYGGKEKLDDIDHLGNRRVRSVGELLQQQLKAAFTKMERIARERMNQETDFSVKPQDLVANKPIVATIKEFFGSSQFSQFMDQINPLAELTHKRRLTALGSGGLNRDRAGFEVRDVHYTHYGRMCPIETPEGPNIGLIVSLANYTRVNKYGFLETPYRKVVDGRATDEVVYLDANDEERYHIAQASAELKSDGSFVNKDVPCRLKGDYMTVAPEEVSYMDVSPKQVISVAASLIPFLEHDDANRALMGSNMQRQAVPLVFPEAPRVGTGMEAKTAYDSGVLVKATRRSGTVSYVSSERIEVSPDESPLELLPSEKGPTSIRFRALETGVTELKAELKTGKTTISAFITVKVKDRVADDEVVSILVEPQYIELNKDSDAARQFPLARVAYHGGAEGERLKKELTEWKADSSLTGVVDARRLRPTKEMKSKLKDELGKRFDENLREIRPDRRSGEGYVTVYAADKATVYAKIFVKVSAGDPGERTPLLLPNTSEFTLEKGAEGEVGVRVVGVDSPSVVWSVVDTYAVEKFQRTNQDTCFSQKPIVDVGEKVARGGILADGSATDGGELALGRNILVGFVPWDGYNYEDAVLISERVVKEDIYTSIHIRELSTDVRETKLGSEKLTRDIPSVSDKKIENLDEDGIVNIGTMVRPGHILIGKISPKNESDTTPEFRLLNSIFGEKAKDVRDVSLKVPHGTEGVVIDVQRFRRDSGDDLPPGVEETIKVLIATKRKLRQGDKMAGRHGNKGVVSRILPEEDMPFMADGTPLDVCLNPMGVPSRMNIGQLMETQLGWAAAKLDQWYTSPVFQSASQKQIEAKMAEAGLPKDSKTVLYDGRTGLPFVNPVFCGYIYYLKLHHLVDDKMHARSTGPYSLVTQQPLGGKAQFGGQRLGEMEVWALEAYGAANTLHELLTIKSDDMDGRNNVYNSIVKGNAPASFGIPEAFNVLVQEIRGLALDMSVYDYKGKQVPLTERDEELINKKANQTSRS